MRRVRVSRVGLLLLLTAFLFGSAPIGNPSEAETAAASITIASLNAENFGWAGAYCKSDEDLALLAQILIAYDLVAVQEVMRASVSAQRDCYNCTTTTCHVEQLVDNMVSLSGDPWHFVCAMPKPYGTRHEFYVLLYNSAVLCYLGNDKDVNTCFVQEPLAGFTVRPPMYAYFRSQNFDFVILNYHAPSTGGNVRPQDEAQYLWPAMVSAYALYDPYERDVILVGDFNLPCIRAYFPPWILRLVEGGTTSARSGGQPYDTLLIDERFTLHEYSGTSGINRAPIDHGLSNHAVVWATFWTHLDDDD